MRYVYNLDTKYIGKYLNLFDPYVILNVISVANFFPIKLLRHLAGLLSYKLVFSLFFVGRNLRSYIHLRVYMIEGRNLGPAFCINVM